MADKKKDFKEVPDGRYICKFAKCEYGVSKKGRPQLKTWFRIMEGEFKGQYLFYYQPTSSEVGIKIANEVFTKAQELGIGPKDSARFEVNVVTKGEYRNYYINEDKELWD